MPRAIRTAILCAFGLVSGAVWSLVPGRLSELLRSPAQTATVVVAGSLTGLVITLLFAERLRTADWRSCVVLGLVALPLGAFVWGVVVASLHTLVPEPLGVSFRFEHESPIGIGAAYAAFASTWFAPFLLPVSVGTSVFLACLGRAMDAFESRHNNPLQQTSGSAAGS